MKDRFSIPSRIYRGFLAEPYDGIGKYVRVSLARSSTAAAKLVRVAAGDFGGGRTFPAGTPVTVFSIHGRLEVGLGNFPQRCWTLPIQLLWRAKITYTPGLEDFSSNFEFDLISHWDGIQWGTYSYGGVLLQNSSITTPSIGIDTYGGGEIAAPNNHWQGETASFVENVLPDPTGQFFFVKHEITAQRSKAKAWFDGNPEPDWQIEKFDTAGNRIFEPGQDLHFYAYADANKYQVDYEIDTLTILKGYGRTPILIDNFNREVAAGIHANWGAASSGIGNWVNEFIGDPGITPISATGGTARMLGDATESATLGNQTLLIPRCSRI